MRSVQIKTDRDPQDPAVALLRPGMSLAKALVMQARLKRVVLCLVASTGCTDSEIDAPQVCPMAEMTADVGTLPALTAQRCNVVGSMGQLKWYRLAATLADGAIVQLELYDGVGAFAGGTVRTGTFPIETDFGNCGVCLRALGDKGGSTETEYFGSGGMVTVTEIGGAGAPISATVTDAILTEVDASHAAVNGGCTAMVASVRVEGTVTDVGGSGGGGGLCPATVGQ
jgi:hypothetical protein